jgi:hypothetical protein
MRGIPSQKGRFRSLHVSQAQERDSAHRELTWIKYEKLLFKINELAKNVMSSQAANQAP